MIKKILLYWFKVKAGNSARKILIHHYGKKEVQDILLGYWQKYLQLKNDIPAMPTMGGSVMLNLAAMSTAFYHELTGRGKSKEEATKLFYDIAWKVYIKMGRFSWRLAGIGKKGNYERLLKATRLFRAFPFNSPSYVWQDVKTDENTVGFDCMKCPVAEYFSKNGLSDFCAATWCALDYPLAELWDAKLERSGSIAEGAEKCDFRWVVDKTDLNKKK